MSGRMSAGIPTMVCPSSRIACTSTRTSTRTRTGLRVRKELQDATSDLQPFVKITVTTGTDGTQTFIYLAAQLLQAGLDEVRGCGGRGRCG